MKNNIESKYTFFSSTCGIFTKLDHFLGHKTNLNKFKRVHKVSSPTMFSDHSGIKVEIENRKIFAECRKYGKIKNHIFKQPRDQKMKLQGKLEVYLN